MTKKILFFLFAIALSVNSFAMDMVDMGEDYTSQSYSYLKAKFPKGVTFYADYSKDINGDRQMCGNPTATFTATRAAATPATWIDASGVIQVTTTSNAPRITKGYYDTTGFHSYPGLMVEAAGTNLITRTDGTASGAGLWTSWTVSGTTTGAFTNTQVACPTLSSIAGTNAQRVQYTAPAGDNPAKNFQIVDTVSSGAASVVQNDTVTVSCWARSQTGNSGVTIKLGMYSRNNLDAYIAAYTGSDFISSLTTAWKRFTYTVQITDATADRVRGYLTVESVFDGDTVDIEIYGMQIEKNTYATSWIPTAASALTRNAEVLTYPTAGNRTAGTETIIIKFMPEWDGTDLAASTYLMDTATKSRAIYGNTSDFIQFQPNATDTAGATVSSTSKPAENTSYVVGLVCNYTGDPNSSIYYNGSSQATDNNDFTSPAWGSAFYVGSSNGSISQLNGIISKVVIFNRALTAGELSSVTNLL
jgi:hypothetical protein